MGLMRYPRAVWIGIRVLWKSARADQPRESRGRRLEWHFDTGVASYLSGRMAFFSRQLTLSGNHFHRAIEMFLKGCLGEPLRTNKRLHLRHDLWRAWRRFKGTVDDATLSRFDHTIRALEELQQLRSSNGWRGSGSRFGLTWPLRRGPRPIARPPKRQYPLAINDVDELVALLFQTARQHPPAYAAKLSETEVASLRKDNRTGIW